MKREVMRLELCAGDHGSSITGLDPPPPDKLCHIWFLSNRLTQNPLWLPITPAPPGCSPLKSCLTLPFPAPLFLLSAIEPLNCSMARILTPWTHYTLFPPARVCYRLFFLPEMSAPFFPFFISCPCKMPLNSCRASTPFMHLKFTF